MTKNDSNIPVYDGHGDQFLMENDRVAAWLETFVPNKETAPHVHSRDYIAIALDDGAMDITGLYGEPEDYALMAGELEAAGEGDTTRISFSAGTVVYSRVPPTGHGHKARNTGKENVRFVLVEIKGTGAEGASVQGDGAA